LILHRRDGMSDLTRKNTSEQRANPLSKAAMVRFFSKLFDT
jgi:hypothetical protein